MKIGYCVLCVVCGVLCVEYCTALSTTFYDYQMSQDLPLEVWYHIAKTDELTYRALMSLPFFARSLNSTIIAEFKKHFDHWCVHTDNETHWFRGLCRHKLGGPAIERLNGTSEYWQDDRFITACSEDDREREADIEYYDNIWADVYAATMNE